MIDKQTGLTGKQQAFIDHYTGDCKYNGTEAARRAGYKGNSNTLGQVSKENLLKPTIKAAIQAKAAKVAEKIDVSVEFVVKKLLNALNIAEERNNLAAIARILELLGRYKAMFTDNITTTDVIRQRELDEAEQAEAIRLSEILIREDLANKAG